MLSLVPDPDDNTTNAASSPAAPNNVELDLDDAPFLSADLVPTEGLNLDDNEEALIGQVIPAAVAFLGLAFIACTLVIAGMPPLSGFVGKLAMVHALLNPLGLGVLARPWLGEAGTALLAVSLVSCWQWLGIPTMMFVAALRNISEDLLEAADIEGCNSFQAFWHIKLPLVRPVAGMVAILTFVSNFNAFDAVYALETVNGGPNYATDLIGTLFYRVGIAGQHPVGIPDQGLGAAIAVITFIVLAIFVIPTLRLTQSKGDI